MKEAPYGKNALGKREWISQIASFGHSYPSELVDNAAYLERCRFPINATQEELEQEMNIRTRTWCAEDENTWTMARDAARRALAADPELAKEIDVVVVASGTTMPVILPPEAENAGVADISPLILKDLGREDALGIDLKATYCTGFLRGLQVADGLLANPNYRAALVIATEQGSRLSTAETNRSKFCFLMSDSAGAVVLRKRPRGEARGLIDYLGHHEPSAFYWVGIGPDGLSSQMSGIKAGDQMMRMMADTVRALLARNGLTASDVDWLVPIQTHHGMIEGLRQTLDWPVGRVLWRGDVTGFAGSSSIPSVISAALEDRTIHRGQLVLAVAVGAGLNCGGALFHV